MSWLQMFCGPSCHIYFILHCTACNCATVVCKRAKSVTSVFCFMVRESAYIAKGASDSRLYITIVLFLINWTINHWDVFFDCLQENCNLHSFTHQNARWVRISSLLQMKLAFRVENIFQVNYKEQLQNKKVNEYEETDVVVPGQGRPQPVLMFVSVSLCSLDTGKCVFTVNNLVKLAIHTTCWLIFL